MKQQPSQQPHQHPSALNNEEHISITPWLESSPLTPLSSDTLSLGTNVSPRVKRPRARALLSDASIAQSWSIEQVSEPPHSSLPSVEVSNMTPQLQEAQETQEAQDNRPQQEEPRWLNIALYLTSPNLCLALIALAIVGLALEPEIKAHMRSPIASSSLSSTGLSSTGLLSGRGRLERSLARELDLVLQADIERLSRDERAAQGEAKPTSSVSSQHAIQPERELSLNANAETKTACTRQELITDPLLHQRRLLAKMYTAQGSSLNLTQRAGCVTP